MQFTVRPVREDDAPAIRALMRERWEDESVVVHDAVYLPHTLPGFIAEDETGARVGVCTYTREEGSCELVTLDSLREGRGVGTALVQAVIRKASELGCTRLWCVTTNDNIPAIGFYQKRGFRILSIDRGAVERARKLKPSIPLHGWYGIPIRNEITLERSLVPVREE